MHKKCSNLNKLFDFDYFVFLKTMIFLLWKYGNFWSFLFSLTASPPRTVHSCKLSCPISSVQTSRVLHTEFRDQTIVYITSQCETLISKERMSLCWVFYITKLQTTNKMISWRKKTWDFSRSNNNKVQRSAMFRQMLLWVLLCTVLGFDFTHGCPDKICDCGKPNKAQKVQASCDGRGLKKIMAPDSLTNVSVL